MNVDKNISQTLSQSAYVMNTIGGGMAMPKVRFKAYDDHYLFRLRVPGVDPNNFNIEIDHQNLFIYQQIHFDDELEIPHLVRRLIIPAEVNYRNITAEYHQGLITIKLPFNELANGYHRDIDLEMN